MVCLYDFFHSPLNILASYQGITLIGSLSVAALFFPSRVYHITGTVCRRKKLEGDQLRVALTTSLVKSKIYTLPSRNVNFKSVGFSKFKPSITEQTPRS